jgi:hypothetical protein
VLRECVRATSAAARDRETQAPVNVLLHAAAAKNNSSGGHRTERHTLLALLERIGVVALVTAR